MRPPPNYRGGIPRTPNSGIHVFHQGIEDLLRNQIFKNENTFLYLCPLQPATIQDVVIITKILTYFDLYGLKFLVRAFPPATFASKSALTNFWSFIFHFMRMIATGTYTPKYPDTLPYQYENHESLSGPLNVQETYFVLKAQQYSLFQDMQNQNAVTKGLTALARWLSAIQIRNDSPTRPRHKVLDIMTFVFENAPRPGQNHLDYNYYSRMPI